MQELKVIKLTNANGLELEVLNLGATIISLKVPNKDKNLVNVVASLQNINDYMHEPYFLGNTIGRYAGRISKGCFFLDNKEYNIFNIDGVHLHGGEKGFDKKIWTIEHVEKGENPSVTLSYFSKHLEEGYPGNVSITATYVLTNTNELKIIYKATTDMTTHINLTNHSYFNLNGNGSILDQELQLNSNGVLEVDAQLIPSGIINNTKNTRFDFLEKSIISRNDFTGFDDTFVLSDKNSKASLYSKETGILMTVKTNQPAMVVFTPPKFEDLQFKDGVIYNDYPAICFETQRFPDAPNKNHFPSTVITPIETYFNETSFEFSIN